MRNDGLEEAQAGIKIAGRNINNLRYADDTTLTAESEEELKSLLIKSGRGEWKSWLKAQHSENKDHGIWSHHFMGNRWGNSVNSGWLYFFVAPKSLQMVTAAMTYLQVSLDLLPGRKVMTNLDSILKSRDITLSTKVCLVKAMVFPVVMYGCESWTIKKAECWRIDAFWTVVLEKMLDSPLDCKEIQPVHPKGHQSWVFTGRTDVDGETPILQQSVAKSWLIWKDPDVRKDWGQEEKGTTEDEMVGWHHWLNGHGFGWTLGGGDGQGGLVCCGSWGCKESDMTEWLNWTELNHEKNQNRHINMLIWALLIILEFWLWKLSKAFLGW